MKHLNKFNEADIQNPHAWRNKPAAEKETNILDMVRGGDVDALEDFLHANEADLKRNVTMAAKFSAPGASNENPTIYDYVMDTYSDLVDMEAVDKWLKYDRKKPEASRRDIDEHGNDWYGFDHPEDLGERLKYIKTFESFKLNEGQDMMFMPVDPIAGMGDLYYDIADAIRNKIDEVTESLKKATAPEVAKIKSFMLKTFGTTIPEINEKTIEKLKKVLGLDAIKGTYKEGENIVVKICGLVQQILGFNIRTFAGIPFGIVLGCLMGPSPSSITLGIVGPIALLWLFIEIMKLFGYNGEDFADFGKHNPSKDIRSKKTLMGKIDRLIGVERVGVD